MLCGKCNGMLDLDILMTGEGYTHHASYTSLVASANSGCELCQRIKDHQWVPVGGELDDAYDQDLPVEETQIWCYAPDRRENVRGIGIRIAQDVRKKRRYARGNKMLFLIVWLRLSTTTSIKSFPSLRPFKFSFAHRRPNLSSRSAQAG